MIFLAIALLVIILILQVSKNRFKDKKRHFINISKYVLVIIFLELTLFNVNSYRLLLGNYEEKEYTINARDVKKNNDLYEFEIKDINTEIATVKLDLDTDILVLYEVLYTDETSSEYRELPAKTYVNGLENSKSIPCFFSGKTKKIKILMKLDDSNVIYENAAEKTFKVNSLKINTPIPFSFNALRVLALVVITIFIYMYKNASFFNIPYKKANIKQYLCILIFVSIYLFGLFFCVITSPIEEKLYTRYYVDAIMDGKAYLNEEPSKELTELDNPYDKTERLEKDVDFIQDAAYYNGKYYVYFGILPVIILLIPFKLITGVYLEAAMVVLIFSVLASIFMIKLLIAMYKRWFKEVPFKLLLICMITMLLGNLMFWMCRRPIKYEIVIVSGLYLILQGAFLAFKSIENEKISYKYLFLACCSMALAIACRPNLLIASLLLIPLIIYVIRKNKERVGILKLLIIVVIPYIVVGIGLMIFNYVRFNNVFEFGANYQLTCNDIGNLKYRVITIPIGIIDFLFSLPGGSTDFPFLCVTANPVSFYGFYFRDALAAGIFILNPILFALLFIRTAKKYMKKELFILIIELLIVGTILLILDVMMGGSCQRYAADFLWMYVFAAILIVFTIYKNIKSENIKKYIIKLILIIAIITGIVNFLLCFVQGENNFLKKACPEVYNFFRYSIAFWE